MRLFKKSRLRRLFKKIGIYDGKRIYLAAPYSHENEVIQSLRAKAIGRKAALLMLKENYIVFSPISHTHDLSKMFDIFVPDTSFNWKKFAFWLRQDLSYIIDWCDELHVYCLPGWRWSRGVKLEIITAYTYNIPIIFHARDASGQAMSVSKKALRSMVKEMEEELWAELPKE